MEIYLVRHTSVDIPAGYAYLQTWRKENLPDG